MYIFYLKHCIKNELHVLYSIYIDNISYLYYTVKNDILKKKLYKISYKVSFIVCKSSNV